MNKYDVLILILCYIFLPKVGYVWNGEMSGHLLFTFCHSNIFHLLCNIMVILSFKQKIRYEMYIISLYNGRERYDIRAYRLYLGEDR